MLMGFPSYRGDNNQLKNTLLAIGSQGKNWQKLAQFYGPKIAHKWGQAYLIDYSGLPILSQGLFYHSN
jgi:hypothetical protein